MGIKVRSYKLLSDFQWVKEFLLQNIKRYGQEIESFNIEIMKEMWYNLV